MKNKWLAAGLNIVPGLGYLYLGVRLPFALILLLMLPTVIFVAYADPALSSSSTADSSMSWGVLLMLGVPALAFIVDAFNEAKRVNRLATGEAEKENHKTAENSGETAEAPLFLVSTRKFVVLSLVTWSAYTVYWAYRNWQAIKHHKKSSLSPFWRAIFTLFFLYALLRDMQDIMRERDKTTDLSVLDRTVGYIGLYLASLWRPLLLAGVLCPFLLMGVQNKVNQLYAPGHTIGSRLNRSEWIITILGVASTVTICLSLFLPSQY